mgnify:CR=1 FL=1
MLRSQALSIRSKDFVAASQVTGDRAGWIMWREILPNMASVVMGTLLGCIIGAIGAQAGLEFLGLGDGVLEYGLPLRRDIARAVRIHRPDVVIGLTQRDLLRFLRQYFDRPLRLILREEDTLLSYLSDEARRLQARYLRKYAEGESA